MNPSTVLTVVLVVSLFITDDVNSSPVPSAEPPFQVLDCGKEGKCLLFIQTRETNIADFTQIFFCVVSSTTNTLFFMS